MSKTGEAQFRSWIDFETLFVHQWFQDFPVISDDRRWMTDTASEWTIHVAACVKQVASLMGLFPVFEKQKFDCKLMDVNRRLVGHLEWEWKDASQGINEIPKLEAAARTPSPPEFSALFCYSPNDTQKDLLKRIAARWAGVATPLLLIWVSRNNAVFGSLETYLFEGNGDPRRLRNMPALPWMVTGTRWTAKPQP